MRWPFPSTPLGLLDKVVLLKSINEEKLRFFKKVLRIKFLKELVSQNYLLL